MEPPIGGQQRPTLRQREGGAAKSGNLSPGLRHNEHSSGVIPRLEYKLHIALQPPAGHITQLQAGAAGAAHVLAPVVQRPHLAKCRVRQIPAAGNGAGGQKAVRQPGDSADLDGSPVSECSAAPAGGEALLRIRIVYHTEDDLSTLR